MKISCSKNASGGFVTAIKAVVMVARDHGVAEAEVWAQSELKQWVEVVCRLLRAQETQPEKPRAR